jgi:hypothetical protein
LRAIEARQEYRSRLRERDLQAFDSLSIGKQDRLRQVLWNYPDGVPTDAPDPFFGPQRNVAWRLYYANRARIRQQAVA